MKRSFSSWGAVSSIFIACIGIIFFDFIYQLFTPVGENWEHIKKYLLQSYIQDTLLICLIVALSVAMLGTTLAWLVATYRFPGSSILPFLLLLPLSIPPYIGAYIYVDIFSYTGALQKLSQKYNWSFLNFSLDIVNIYGASVIFILFLLPYVYLVVSSCLQKQSSAYLENARLLGASEVRIFVRVLAPLARGQIVGGTTLVLMEVLSDYGVVSYLGLTTLSTGIFNSWFGLGDITIALRIAAILLVVVVGVIVIERWSRLNIRYSSTTTKTAPLVKKQLSRFWGIVATIGAYGYIALAFIIPTLQLLYWSYLSYEKVLTKEFFMLAFSSISLASVSAFIIICISVIIANYHRLARTNISAIYSNITLFGYSIPGTVIAIVMVMFFVDLDRTLGPIYRYFSPNAPTLLLSMSLMMLTTGYIIRFLGVGFQPIEAGFEKIGKAYHEAGKILGAKGSRVFLKVDLPMLKPALISAFILVFVDIVKELPLALFLRPFNFHTLATRVFNYANDEQIIEGAIPSLCIIIISASLLGIIYGYTKKEEL